MCRAGHTPERPPLFFRKTCSLSRTIYFIFISSSASGFIWEQSSQYKNSADYTFPGLSHNYKQTMVNRAGWNSSLKVFHSVQVNSLSSHKTMMIHHNIFYLHALVRSAFPILGVCSYLTEPSDEKFCAMPKICKNHFCSSETVNFRAVFGKTALESTVFELQKCFLHIFQSAQNFWSNGAYKGGRFWGRNHVSEAWDLEKKNSKFQVGPTKKCIK